MPDSLPWDHSWDCIRTVRPPGGGLFAAIRTPRPAILRRYIAHRPHRGKGSRVFAYRVRKIVILGLQRFDKRASDPYTPPPHAQVAELVDALASGASGLTAVKVRVLSWAPFLVTSPAQEMPDRRPR